LSRLNSSFVLGYHGCDLALARKIVARQASLVSSDNKFDWLGPGIYFWEADPQRAWEWAVARHQAGWCDAPGVVGAVIDLRECLDLLNRQDQDLVRDAYESLAELTKAAGRALPQNRNAPTGNDTDRRARALDCDVIRHLHSIMDYESGADEDEDHGVTTVAIPWFDTVRGMFTEGAELYPGAGFYRQSHVQIAVRNPACIKGLFFPPELDDRQPVQSGEA